MTLALQQNPPTVLRVVLWLMGTAWPMAFPPVALGGSVMGSGAPSAASVSLATQGPSVRRVCPFSIRLLQYRSVGYTVLYVYEKAVLHI